MAIALRAAGAWTATGATSRTPAIPAAQVTGDLMILIAAGKPYNLQWECNTAGWQSLGRGESGTTAAGTDTGSMAVEVWWKVATSDTETDPTVTEVGNSFDCVQAAVCVFSKGATESWNTPVAVFGADETTGTAISVTFASNPGGKAGDYVMLGCGINTDAMGPLTTDLTPSWTGITFGSADPGIEGEGTTGGDMAAHYMSRPVSSGTASAAPTCTGTGTASGGADRLEAVFIRLRVQTIIEADASATGTSSTSITTGAIKGSAASTNGISYIGGAESLADSYPTSNQNIYFRMGGESGGYPREVAQSFQSTGGKVTKVTFNLNRADETLYDVYAKLYAMTGTLGNDSTPTGTALATSESVNLFDAIPEIQWTLIDFVFTGANQYQTESGTSYCIALYAGGALGPTEYTDVGVDTTSPTHNGNLAYIDTESGLWVADNTKDVCFYIYMAGANAAAVIPTAVSVEGTSTAQADGQDANALEYFEADANTQGTSATSVEAAAISEIIIGAANTAQMPAIAGLVAWYHADALSLNDGDSVNSWPDSSGTGNGLTLQGATPPIYKTGIVNGRPVVRWNATDDNSRLLKVGFQGLTDDRFTIFVVGKQTSKTVSMNFTQPRLWLTTEGYLVIWDSYGNAPPDRSGAFHVYSLVNYHVNTLGQNCWVDRENSGISFWSGNGIDTFSVCLVSAIGDISEILIYDGTLSDTDRQAVENYLGAEYGLFNYSDGIATAQAQSATICATEFGGSPADFPSEITGLVGHYAADSLSLSDGDPVTSLNDLTGINGALQTNGGDNPTFKTNIVNGKPVVRFNGTSNGMSAAGAIDGYNFVQDTPSTCFVVAKQTSGYSFDYIGPIRCHGFGSSRSYVLGFRLSGYAEINDGQGHAITGVVNLSGAFHLLTGVENGASSELWVEGVSVGSGTLTTSGIGTIQMGHSSPYGNFWGGDFAEVCIYNGMLSTANRKTVENYFLVKYGLIVPAGGIGRAIGVGEAIESADASAQGTSTSAADSGALTAVEASAICTSTAQADGENAAGTGIIEAEFTVSGTSTVSSDSSTIAGVETSVSSTSTASADTSSILASEASATCISATTINSAWRFAASYAVANTSATTFNSGATKGTPFTVPGTSTTTFNSAWRFAAQITLSCTSTTTYVSGADARVTASATGTSTAQADYENIASPYREVQFSVSCTSTAAADSRATKIVEASTAGTSSSAFALRALWPVSSSIDCVSTAASNSGATKLTTASATGVSATDAQGADAAASGSDAQTAGTSTAQANSGARKIVEASTTASSTAAANTAQRDAVTASATGTSSTNVALSAIARTTASTAGSSATAINSAATKSTLASTAGTSVVDGDASMGGAGSDAYAIGTSTAQAFSRAIKGVDASSTSVSTATGQARAVTAGVATSICAAVVTGNALTVFAVRYVVAGTGITSVEAEIRHFARVDAQLGSILRVISVGVAIEANSEIALDPVYVAIRLLPQVAMNKRTGGRLNITEARGKFSVVPRQTTVEVT